MASVRNRTWSTDGREQSAWIVDYRDSGDKRRLKTFKTKKAADAWLVQAQHQLAIGTHTPDRESVTVKVAGDLWLRRCDVERLEPHTLRQYRSHLDFHITPALGAVKLSKLSAPMIARFVDTMLAGSTRATTRKVLTSVRGLLTTAMRSGLVAQNVASAVRVGAQDRHRGKVEIPTPDEMRALLAAAAGRWRPFLHVAVFTGLRASELRGLCWADVDLEASKLTVSRRADERGVIGSPKSESSRRTIRLPPIARNVMADWRKVCPPSATGLVFPNGAGRPESLANIQNRFWGLLQIGCGVTVQRPNRAGQPVTRPRYGLHVTRHFYASWLISQGLPPKRVQALMGHSTIKLTLDTYGHLWPDAADDAKLEAAEAALLSPAVEMDATRMQQSLLSA